jgi:hypothetical protein
MGGVCGKSDKEQELKLESIIEKTAKLKDLEAEFLEIIQNINYNNSYVRVSIK